MVMQPGTDYVSDNTEIADELAFLAMLEPQIVDTNIAAAKAELEANNTFIEEIDQNIAQNSDLKSLDDLATAWDNSVKIPNVLPDGVKVLELDPEMGILQANILEHAAKRNQKVPVELTEAISGFRKLFSALDAKCDEHPEPEREKVKVGFLQNSMFRQKLSEKRDTVLKLLKGYLVDSADKLSTVNQELTTVRTSTAERVAGTVIAERPKIVVAESNEAATEKLKKEAILKLLKQELDRVYQYDIPSQSSKITYSNASAEQKLQLQRSREILARVLFDQMTRNYEKVFKSANIDTKYIPDAMEAVLKGAVYYRNGYHGGGSVELNSRMFPVALVTFMNPKDINNLFANLYTDIGYCLQNNNSDTNMALLAGVLNGKPAPQSMASSGKLIDVETGLAYSDQNELIEMRSYAKYLAKVAKEVDEEMGTTTTVITSLPHAMQEIDKREARIRELEAAVTRQSHLYSRLNDELNSYRSKVTEAEVAVKKAEEESRTKQAEIDKLKKNLETANANSSNETHWKERYLADRTILQDKFDRLKAVLGNIPRPAKPMFGDPPPKTIKVDDVLEIIGRQ